MFATLAVNYASGIHLKMNNDSTGSMRQHVGCKLQHGLRAPDMSCHTWDSNGNFHLTLMLENNNSAAPGYEIVYAFTTMWFIFRACPELSLSVSANLWWYWCCFLSVQSYIPILGLVDINSSQQSTNRSGIWTNIICKIFAIYYKVRNCNAK